MAKIDWSYRPQRKPLTPHQQNELDKVIEMLKTRDVVSLKGLAGVGKTQVIPYLAKQFPSATLAATTHKARSVLAEKLGDAGIGRGVTTFAAACLKFLFTPQLVELKTWLISPDAVLSPALLRGRDIKAARAVVNEKLHRFGEDATLRELGFDPMDHVLAEMPKDKKGDVLIVDEASMLNRDALEHALKVFDKVILVGDDGQLPPIVGEPILEFVDGGVLTEILRQQGPGRRIAEMAHEVRHGALVRSLGVKVEKGLLPGWQAVTWSNASRIKLSLDMRGLLFGDRMIEPQVGEYVVPHRPPEMFRGSGIINGARYRLDDDPGVLSNIRHNRAHEKKFGPIMAFFEDFHQSGKYCPAGELPLRFAYAMTCHAAQGSEFDRVQIYFPDVAAHINSCRAQGDEETHRKWLYTGITRAKNEIRFFS